MRSENALERSDGLRIGPTSGRRRATVAEPTSNIANRAVISRDSAPVSEKLLGACQIFLVGSSALDVRLPTALQVLQGCRAKRLNESQTRPFHRQVAHTHTGPSPSRTRLQRDPYALS